jgi:hypothetical protein
MANLSSNPFDFSDFGGAAPTGNNGREARTDRPQGHVSAGGFDPFATGSPVTRRNSAVDEAFTVPNVQPGSVAVAGPPLRKIAAALAVAVTGIVLSAVAVNSDSTVLLAFAGWLLAGPAAIGVMAWFTHEDTRRRLSSVYSAPTWLPTAYWAVVAVCAVGIGVGAWQIALWAGRQ